jgi:hypothetical protein
MSLQLAAEHLSTKGRGPDDTLVHMSRGEVKSLNDLAMAHGGQLTINPQTGLPEAGFLSAILPMVAGAALGPAGFGLTSALGAGLAVGAGSYLLNPKAGLMGALSAGMGAYGAANLGQALAVEGMNASVPTAAQVTPESLKPFTTDPTAYIGQGPTASQFGSMGESLGQVPSTSTTYNPVGAGNLESMASYPAGAPAPQPFIKGTAGEYLPNPQHPDYNLLKSNPTVNSGAPLMASNAPATPAPSNAAGSFQPSTITQPLASPNASVANLKDMTVTERLGAMQKGLTSGDLGKVASGIISLVTITFLEEDNFTFDATFFYTDSQMILTIPEDVESLIGDIRDEYDEDNEALPTQSQTEDFEVDGLISVDDLRDDSGIEIPEGPYETASGFVMHFLGHIPREGDVASINGIRITVLSMEGKRAGRLLISRVI